MIEKLRSSTEPVEGVASSANTRHRMGAPEATRPAVVR